MFQLVHPALIPGKKTAKTVHDSPDTFSPALVCVCAFACLASWLRNRIRRDFATITLTEDGGGREEIQSVSTDTKWHLASCSCLREALCQNRFLVRCFRTEMTIELALLYTCSTAAWKIFLPHHHHLILYDSCFSFDCFVNTAVLCHCTNSSCSREDSGFFFLPFVHLILKNRLLMKRLEETFVCGENI